MKIAGGWDHHGRIFKENMQRLIEKLGHEFVNMGAQTGESSDYPDFAIKVAEAVSRGECDQGVLICGTGIGMSIAANKVNGVRAAVVYDENTARASREHNDANVLCLGEATADGPTLEPILKIWLATEHAGGRHAHRVGKIVDYENRCS